MISSDDTIITSVDKKPRYSDTYYSGTILSLVPLNTQL